MSSKVNPVIIPEVWFSVFDQMPLEDFELTRIASLPDPDFTALVYGYMGSSLVVPNSSLEGSLPFQAIFQREARAFAPSSSEGQSAREVRLCEIPLGARREFLKAFHRGILVHWKASGFDSSCLPSAPPFRAVQFEQLQEIAAKEQIRILLQFDWIANSDRPSLTHKDHRGKASEVRKDFMDYFISRIYPQLSEEGKITLYQSIEGELIADACNGGTQGCLFNSIFDSKEKAERLMQLAQRGDLNYALLLENALSKRLLGYADLSAEIFQVLCADLSLEAQGMLQKELFPVQDPALPSSSGGNVPILNALKSKERVQEAARNCYYQTLLQTWSKHQPSFRCFLFGKLAVRAILRPHLQEELADKFKTLEPKDQLLLLRDLLITYYGWRYAPKEGTPKEEIIGKGVEWAKSLYDLLPLELQAAVQAQIDAILPHHPEGDGSFCSHIALEAMRRCMQKPHSSVKDRSEGNPGYLATLYF